MAGHARSVDTGTAHRTTSGKTRRVRQHLPPGDAEAARRRKHHDGARAIANHKLNRERDPLRQLDIARDYVRSAATKYQVNGEIANAIEALLAAGDRIYHTGKPQPARRDKRRSS